MGTKSQHTVSTLDELLCIYDGVVEFSECTTTSTTTREPTLNEQEPLVSADSASVIFIMIVVVTVIAIILFLQRVQELQQRHLKIHGANSVVGATASENE